jgi:hypothetical protein
MTKHILTLSGASDGLARTSVKKDRPTANLKVGQCMCILNTRTNKGVSVCRVPPGETRSGIKFAGSCPNPIKTK